MPMQCPQLLLPFLFPAPLLATTGFCGDTRMKLPSVGARVSLAAKQ